MQVTPLRRVVGGGGGTCVPRPARPGRAGGWGVWAAATPRAAPPPPSPAPAATTILGTMTIGWSQSSEAVDEDRAGELVDAFLERGHDEVDTALLYAGGETEKILGRVLAAEGEGRAAVRLSIKANPWFRPADGGGGVVSAAAGEGGLRPDVLREQVETSLARLGRRSAEALYLHAPDAATPIKDSLAVVNQLHQEGRFDVLGLSNYAAWEVAHIHGICREEGWVAPTVCQGMYNAITRQVESELLPACDALGIRFLAYNPLAGGLLTGKHTDPGEVPAGRFQGNAMYLDRFWHPEFFDAVEGARSACEAEGVSLVEASLRWLRLHSRLVPSRGDGLVLGASSVAQLDANLKACEVNAPLPPAVLEALDIAEEVARASCPLYYRGWSMY